MGWFRTEINSLYQNPRFISNKIEGFGKWW